MSLLLSIIVPLRKDSPWIGDFLDSVMKNAGMPESFEVVLGIAHDDTKTDPKDENVRLLRVDQRKRKYGVSDYTNALALEAKGKLIWWLSDECFILTKNFDVLLAREAEMVGDKIFQLCPKGNEKGSGAAYPILTKKWIDVTGRWAGTPSIDSWVNSIAGKLPSRIKALEWLEIEDRNVTGEITTEKYMEHYLDPEVPIDMDEMAWGGEKANAEIEKDAQKLLKAIEQGL